MTRLPALALGALLVCSVPAALAAEQPAGLGLRLLDDPRQGRYLVATARPASELRRRVEVSNTTDRVLEVALYVGAATAGGPGGFDYAPGRAGNELTRWTTVRPTSLTLGPGEVATSEVEVRIPAAASEGERHAVVWAEQVSQTGGISLVSRVGVRTYVTVRDERSGLRPLPVVSAGALVLLIGSLVARQRRLIGR